MGVFKPAGIIIYATVDEHINKKPYLLSVPVYYSDNPDMVEKGIMEPVYESVDAKDMGRARYTIAAMVDMRSKGVPFVILNIKDIPEIKYYLDVYLNDLYDHRGDQVARAYLEKASTLHKDIDKCFRKYLLRYDARKEMMQNNVFEKALQGGSYHEYFQR